jgi:hypothetical protein
MPARLRSDVNLQMSFDSSESTIAFERDQLGVDEVVDLFSRTVVKGYTIAASGVQAVGLDGLTNVQFVYVEADSVVTVALNGVTEAIKVMPRVGGMGAAPPTYAGKLMLWTEGCTGLTITNPGTTVAAVRVCLAGA